MNRSYGIRRRLALTVAIGLTASLAAAPAAAAGGSTGQVEWGACPDPIAAAAPTVQCGTVAVPLDYRDPEGTQIDLMVSRIPSTNPEKRRGVLLLNPGGPGGSALTMPHDLVSLGVPAGVTDAYNLIGMDPRGVGYSARVDCAFTDEQGYRGNVPPWAEDDAAVLAQAAAARAVAEQCAAHDTEGRMAHISTANTARDLDRIRAALGEQKASFLGFSYGSALGAAGRRHGTPRTDWAARPTRSAPPTSRWPSGSTSSRCPGWTAATSGSTPSPPCTVSRAIRCWPAPGSR